MTRYEKNSLNGFPEHPELWKPRVRMVNCVSNNHPYTTDRNCYTAHSDTGYTLRYRRCYALYTDHHSGRVT